MNVLQRLVSLRMTEPTPDDDVRWLRDQLRYQRDELISRSWWRLTEGQRRAVVELTRTLVELHGVEARADQSQAPAPDGAARTARSAARSRDRREAALERCGQNLHLQATGGGC